MNEQQQTIPAMTEKQLFIKMVISAWEIQNKRVDNIVNALTDDQLMKETAPGRNTGIYIFGHLVAINDAILPLLGLGEKLYPQLEKVFITTPDKSGLEFPSIDDLKKYWKEINATLSARFAAMPPDLWFEKHTVVSTEDFAKEPHRNKLNIIITRTVHQGYHVGQLIYLK